MPLWVEEFTDCQDGEYSNEEERMRLVVALAKKNIDKKTGGPFGAAVFNLETNQLVAVGVNLVVSSNYSIAHAEMIAIILAEKVFKTYNLGEGNLPALQLVTSTEPCTMCLGALIWSGLKSVACGARDEDARAIGFDEGPKPSNWVEALLNRGISVCQDICRSEACDALQHYKETGGIIYNASPSLNNSRNFYGDRITQIK